MTGRKHLWRLCMALALLAYGCRAPRDAVAVAGGEHLPVSAFQAYLEAVTGEEWQAVEQRVASRLLDQFLDQEVVVAAVISSNALPPPVQPGRRSAAVRQLLSEVCGPVPPVPRELVEQQVSLRLEQTEPARAHVRQMLLGSSEEAAAARQRVVDGEEFVKVSTEVSMAANADSGGELGLVVEGTLPEPMDEVIFAMTAGSITEPIQSPAGFHIFEVLEMNAAGPPDRGLVEIEVVQALGEEHSRDFIKKCVEDLAVDVGVEVYTGNLWFQYDGKYREDDTDAQ